MNPKYGLENFSPSLGPEVGHINILHSPTLWSIPPRFDRGGRDDPNPALDNHAGTQLCRHDLKV